jgi:hypothetical protein
LSLHRGARQPDPEDDDETYVGGLELRFCAWTPPTPQGTAPGCVEVWWMGMMSLRSALLQLAEENRTRAEKLEREGRRREAEAERLRRTAEQAREVADALRF